MLGVFFCRYCGTNIGCLSAFHLKCGIVFAPIPKNEILKKIIKCDVLTPSRIGIRLLDTFSIKYTTKPWVIPREQCIRFV